MAEHRMDTNVLQALLTTAWAAGFTAAECGEHQTDNPFWHPGPWPEQDDIDKTIALLGANEL